jgi:hypothetical protein
VLTGPPGLAVTYICMRQLSPSLTVFRGLLVTVCPSGREAGEGLAGTVLEFSQKLASQLPGS